MFNTTANMNKSVTHLATKGRKALINLLSVIHNFGVLTPKVFFKLFDAQIQPILLYGSEIWGFSRFECIEKIHLLACKKFLCVGLSTPSCMVYGECGRYPLYINAYMRCLKFWLKI